jgi:Spy/CpxP family protein refolding chaperone
MTTRGLISAIVFGSVSGVASAQMPPDPPGAEGPRAEAGRMVDAYVLSNLQESLGLSDGQFLKLLPLVKRYQAERREAMARRAGAVREMRRLLKSGVATEAEVLAHLKELKAIETDEPIRGRKSMESIDGILSPLQQAKFRVFEAEVGQKLRELMNEMRRQNRPGSRPEGGKPRRRDTP